MGAVDHRLVAAGDGIETQQAARLVDRVDAAADISVDDLRLLGGVTLPEAQAAQITAPSQTNPSAWDAAELQFIIDPINQMRPLIKHDRGSNKNRKFTFWKNERMPFIIF
ncbi:MAG: hypothetical protein WB697_05420 [Stellaceae bacterium]